MTGQEFSFFFYFRVQVVNQETVYETKITQNKTAAGFSAMQITDSKCETDHSNCVLLFSPLLRIFVHHNYRYQQFLSNVSQKRLRAESRRRQ